MSFSIHNILHAAICLNVKNVLDIVKVCHLSIIYRVKHMNTLDFTICSWTMSEFRSLLIIFLKSVNPIGVFIKRVNFDGNARRENFI